MDGYLGSKKGDEQESAEQWKIKNWGKAWWCCFQRRQLEMKNKTSFSEKARAWGEQTYNKVLFKLQGKIGKGLLRLKV